MDRRGFIGTIGCTLLATMRASLAQQPANVRRIGLLTAGTMAVLPPSLPDELRSLGWIDGQNLLIERRAGNGKADAVPALAAELVQLKVDVIMTFGAVAGVAAKNATKTIPIVATSGDPVRFGLVDNMQHPGGNVTGIALIAPELAGKRLELLRELRPAIVRIGELVDPANLYWKSVRKDHEQVYRALGMLPIFVEVTDPSGLEAAVAEVVRRRGQALNVRGDPIFDSNREQIARLAVRHSLPTVAEQRGFAQSGALMSYGPVAGPLAMRSAVLVDKILKGANPGDLPIEQPSKFELVFNLKTAKAIGITIPQSLLLRADEVIQ